MDDYARYQVENGFAREVTKEWALKTIKECEDRGLIHVIGEVRSGLSTLSNDSPAERPSRG